MSVSYGIGIPEHDREGRVITLGFENSISSASIPPIRRTGSPGSTTE